MNLLSHPPVHNMPPQLHITTLPSTSPPRPPHRLQWYEWANAFLLVYSVTDAASFDYLHTLREAIVRTRSTPAQHTPIVIVGTHADMPGADTFRSC
jgi:Ras family protein